MSKLLTFIYLFFSIAITSNAQIGDTIITNEKIKIDKFLNNNCYPMLLKDCDNKENNWISVIHNQDSIFDDFYNIYRVDNNLNILDTINTKGRGLSIRFNNKIYGISNTTKDISPSVFLDSIVFHCNEIGGVEQKKIIYSYESDTLKFVFESERYFFTDDNNFGVFLKCKNDSNYQISKLFIIDTLGNIIKSKIYRTDGDIVKEEIIERGNNFEILSLSLTNDLDNIKLKIINKNTLEMYDSILFDSIFSPYYFKYINDSIFITMINEHIDSSNVQGLKINFVNRNTLKIKTIFYQTNTDDFDYVGYADFLPPFTEKLVYSNIDSIYFVYYSCKETLIQDGGVFSNSYDNHSIRIINFSIDGNVNYYYNFNFDSTKWKQVNGVKTTTDGGIIIAYRTSFTESGIIKFMPNGFVGLSNVETGEKASLRVYPNPAKDFVLVDIEADKFVEADIEIYDLGGRMVKKSKLSAKVGNRIDVSSLKAGVYSYRVALNGKGVSGKIVIGE